MLMATQEHIDKTCYKTQCFLTTMFRAITHRNTLILIHIWFSLYHLVFCFNCPVSLFDTGRTPQSGCPPPYHQFSFTIYNHNSFGFFSHWTHHWTVTPFFNHHKSIRRPAWSQIQLRETIHSIVTHSPVGLQPSSSAGRLLQHYPRSILTLLFIYGVFYNFRISILFLFCSSVVLVLIYPL